MATTVSIFQSQKVPVYKFKSLHEKLLKGGVSPKIPDWMQKSQQDMYKLKIDEEALDDFNDNVYYRSVYRLHRLWFMNHS